MKKITLLLAVVFSGIAANAQVLLTENFDTALDWTVAHTSGTATQAGWAMVTEGTDPACTPFSGAGMAEFNSADIAESNAYTLTSPAITFGGNFYKITFSIYRNGAESATADKIKVFYSPSGALTGSTLLSTINRSIALAPVVETEGWYTYDAFLPNAITGDHYIIISGSSANGNNIYLDNISVEQVNTLNNAQLSTVTMNSALTMGTYPVAGAFRNIGANAITACNLNWQVNGGSVHTQALTGLNINPGQSYNYSHSEQWVTSPGVYNLSVWVSNVNGDSAATSNTITKTGYVLNEVFPKTVVYEEATGTWCGWCVRGHVGLKDMDHYHPDATWIGIAVHNADPMVLGEYDTAINTFISGYPSGTLNRGSVEIDPGSLETPYQGELAKIPIAKVGIANQTWNPTTREITFDAQAIFAVDINNINYNLAAVIVENNVVGTTSTWRQHNYYAGGTITDWTGFNWGTYPSYIPAESMIYNHVGRALLGGFHGVDGSVPTSVTYNVPNSYTFTHILPANENEANIEIVVMLIDNVTGKIANAKEIALDTTLATAAFNATHYGVYPNPTNGVFHIGTEKPVSVSIVDVLGKVIYHAENVTRETAINLSGFQKGIYMARITGDAKTSTEKIILN